MQPNCVKMILSIVNSARCSQWRFVDRNMTDESGTSVSLELKSSSAGVNICCAEHITTQIETAPEHDSLGINFIIVIDIPRG